jgi:phosphohistidine swiveling domain-containing protein
VNIRFASLESPAAADAAVFGGKAAGLFRLITAGATVPSGFAVSATADPVESWIAEEREELHTHLARLLRRGPVAIRSSAIAEDSPAQSFAGMFESVLRVTSLIDAVAATDRCIASGRSERVLAYAASRDPLPVGLVVQAMIEPRAAGVCFTLDPAGKDHAVVIEAVAGRGDRLVSGAADPERWRMYAGAREWEARCSGANVLASDEAIAIASEARRLETELGRPLDLEWAIDAAGTRWWLQARPITAAVPPPEWIIERSLDDANDGPVTLWANWNVRETMPEPIFPLTWTFWRDEIVPMMSDLLYGIRPGSSLSRSLSGLDLVHGRIYFNMNALLGTPLLGPFVPHVLSIMDARAAAVVRDLVLSGTLIPRRVHFSRIAFGASALKAGVVSAFRMRIALSPARALRSLERGAAEISARAPLATLGDEQLIEEMKLWTSPASARLRDGMPMQIAAILVYGFGRRVFRNHPEAVNHLATGTPANPTTQISLAVERLIADAAGLEEDFAATRSWPDLRERLERRDAGQRWLERLNAFLAKYGHRGPQEFDLGATRWADDPSMIIELVRIGLAVPVAETMRARLERLASRREEVLSSAIAASPAWRRPLMRMMGRMVWHCMPMREAAKHYGVVVFQRIRNAALELGRRLVERGILETQQDVFYVEWPELGSMAHGAAPREGLRQLINDRKKQLKLFRASRPPDMLRSDHVPIEEEDAAAEEDGTLRGVGVSPGRAEGRVRILRTPDPRAMEEGDVLVVEYADPGWTPLFPRASAVVMEIGGLMCHAAVVAREMGLPAVFGVRHATSALRDGDSVSVDGATGAITRIPVRE